MRYNTYAAQTAKMQLKSQTSPSTTRMTRVMRITTGMEKLSGPIKMRPRVALRAMFKMRAPHTLIS